MTEAKRAKVLEKRLFAATDRHAPRSGADLARLPGRRRERAVS
jgi:hypothetical protein